MTQRLLIVVSLGGVAACGQSDQTGLPQPIPIPGNVYAQRVPYNKPDKDTAVADVLVVGISGAVDSAGEVEIETHAGVFETESTESGTFSLEVKSKVEETALLRFNGSEPAEFVIEGTEIIDTIPPDPPYGAIPGVPPIEKPIADTVTVVGQWKPNTSIIGVNLDTGAAATTTSGDEIAVVDGFAVGVLRLEIGARSGDELRLFEAGEQTLGSSWGGLEVP